MIDSTYLRGERVTVMSHPSIMMYRDAVLAVGKYHPIKTSEDVDLFLRLAEYGRIANIPEVLLKYRYHETNVSNAASFHKTLDWEYWEIIRDAHRRRNLPELSMPPEAVRRSPEAETPPPETQQNNTEIWAWWALGSGYVRTARKHARRVLASAPFSPRSWRLMYCAIRGY